MTDPVREYLERRGARADLVTGGAAGLVRHWEQIVEDVERGYQLTLDDYRNDLDLRDLLAGALAAATADERESLTARVEAADRAFRDATEPGRPIRNDTPHWWYRRRPRAMGSALRKDLA